MIVRFIRRETVGFEPTALPRRSYVAARRARESRAVLRTTQEFLPAYPHRPFGAGPSAFTFGEKNTPYGGISGSSSMKKYPLWPDLEQKWPHFLSIMARFLSIIIILDIFRSIYSFQNVSKMPENRQYFLNFERIMPIIAQI